MSKLVPFLFYLIFMACYVAILEQPLTLWGITPNVPLLIVLLVAVYKSETTAIWFALCAAAVVSAGVPGQMGLLMLVYVFLATLTTQLREHLDMKSLVAKLFAVAGGMLLGNLIIPLFNGLDGYFLQIVTRAIPGVLYASLLTYIFLLFKERYITRQSIEEAL